MKNIFTLLMIWGITFTFGYAQNEEVRAFQLQNRFNTLTQSTRNTTDISPSDVNFWVGSGANEVVAVFYWCQDTPIGLAYGYRWDGTKTIGDMLTEIDNADTRFSISISSWVNNYSYIDNNYNLYIASAGSLMYTVNDNYANGLTDVLADGDYFEMVEFGNCDTPTNVVPVSDPNPPVVTDVTIGADQITYWIGEGTYQAIFVVNWCSPEIALAWGYRFENDSVLVSDMMDDIVAADSRFGYQGGNGMVNNITYNDDNYNLTLAGNYWMYNINGQGALVGFDAQYIVNGDLVKFGDESCGVVDGNWNYAWTTPIQPVSIPNQEIEYFDGIVGTPDCQAVFCENPAILGWATSCTITRGNQNIVNQGLYASYGTEADGIGAATTSTADVVSLGDSGVAILTFDQPILDGNGYDFAVFENSLNDVFLELAFVEVSSDGIHYVRFPATSYTPIDIQINNAGSVDATHIHQLAGKYRAGWGTPFDLAVLSDSNNLDINNITHIKLIDVIGTIDPNYASRDHLNHIINDPYPTDFASSGFDLDGVAILNGWTPNSITDNNIENDKLNVYPNPCYDVISIETTQGQLLTIWNAQGAIVFQKIADNSLITIDMKSYPIGLYILQSGTDFAKIIKK